MGTQVAAMLRNYADVRRRLWGEKPAAPRIVRQPLPPVIKLIPKPIPAPVVAPGVEPKPHYIPGVTGYIAKFVCQKYGITKADLFSRSHQWKLSRPRHLAYYLVRTIAQKTLPEIGRVFDRDHTTILHGVQQVANRIQNDNAYAIEVDAIATEIRAGLAGTQPAPVYDANTDLSRSIDACYAAIRARKAAGGKGWRE